MGVTNLNFELFLKDKTLAECKEAIKNCNNFFKGLIKEICEGVIIVDEDFLIKDVLNNHFCNWVGINKKECIGKSIFKFFNKIFDFNEGEIKELYLKTAYETLVPVDVRILKKSFNGRNFYIVIIVNQKELFEKNKKLDRIISLYKALFAINDLILRALNADELFNEFVKILVEIAGYDFALIGRVDKNYITPIAFYGDKEFCDFLKENVISKKVLFNLNNNFYITTKMDKDEYLFFKKIAIPFKIEANYSLLKHEYFNKQFILEVFLKEDYEIDELEIGLLKQILNNLSFASAFVENKNYPEFIAKYDVITMLPNRRGFFEEVQAEIKENHNKNIQSALVIIDINSFYRINETFGFWMGDLVLRKIAQKIKENISKDDIAGRIGGDQFGLWFSKIHSKKEVERKIQKIFNNYEIEVDIENHKFVITFSMGAAIFPKDGSDLESLFSKAYISMKKRKKIGKGLNFYEEEFGVADNYKKLELELELIDALKNREFVLFYQPIVDLKKEKIFGAEALLRWKSKKRGLVRPAEFIPVLEETGMIIEVGYWIMDEICRFFNRHSNLDLTISMNLSVKQMYLGKFAELLYARMKKCKTHLNKLCIEVTESILMENIDKMIKEMEELQKWGVKFEIDDFGTGYSSLSYLKKLPVFVLKIDKSFIDNIPHTKEDNAIVKAVITMAHILEKKVVAEGVEKKSQLEFLKENKCDYIQGYFYSKPLAEKDFIEFIKKFNGF